MPLSLLSIAVARSADLRLQVWAAGSQLLTRWKANSGEDSGWTPWQPFSPPPTDSTGAPTVPSYLFAGQLVAEKTLQPNTGRMQLWGIVAGGTSLSTTVKSSEQPSAPWEPWTTFLAPPPVVPFSGPYSIREGAVVALSDGRLQVFVLVQGGPLLGLWSRVQTSAHVTAGWSEWQQFPSPPSVAGDFTVCQLPDGRTQLWAIGASPDEVEAAVWTMMRESAPGNTSDPLSGWGTWNLFEVPTESGPTTIVSPVSALRAASDGQGRSYLWINQGTSGPTPTNNWVYTYSSPSGPPVAWNPLVGFPTPPSQEIYASNSVLAVGVLPAGLLQAFFLNYPAVPQEIWTSWQNLGQLPTKWTSWQNFTP